MTAFYVLNRNPLDPDVLTPHANLGEATVPHLFGRSLDGYTNRSLHPQPKGFFEPVFNERFPKYDAVPTGFLPLKN